MADWTQPILSNLANQLEDNLNVHTDDLHACGPHIIADLRTAMHDLTGDKRKRACEILDDLANEAYRMMAASEIAPTCWRRLYTDAKIFRALTDLTDPNVPTNEDIARACVARLDHAIITAGPCGEGRLDLIHDLIKETQSKYLESPPRSFTLYQRVRSNYPQPTSPATVTRLESSPSLTSFITTHSRKPFVMSGYACNWPATKSWHSVQYLRSIAGPGRVVPVEVGSDYREDDWTQRIMGWDELLDLWNRRSVDEAKPVLYLAQHDLFKQFPALRDDIAVPDYVYTSLPAPGDFPEYRPPGNEDQLVLNAWLGPVGTVSPAHTDPYYNFYAQIVGRKTVWLAPPSATPHMYPYPSAENSHDDQPHNPATNNTDPSMSNTSRVNVFGKAGEDAFSNFWEHAVPQSMWVTLEPGDVLFFSAWVVACYAKRGDEFFGVDVVQLLGRRI